MTLNALHPDHRKKVVENATKDFSSSDAIMSRCISTLINLSWTEDQVRAKGEGLVAAIKRSVSKPVPESV
jgi:8-amino-3,8-dideoxy-alpha-D-manno-octulosonate transaminase